MGDPAAEDGLLADWLAHYAALMVLIVLIVTVLATTWATLTIPGTEMWTIVVDTTQQAHARQLGVVGEALCKAENTFTEAMKQLGLTGSPDPLYAMVRLRAVPESRMLIVTARADDIYTASTTSDAMAQALVHAFERSGYTGMRILGAPQSAPIPSGLEPPIVALVAAVLAISLGLAVAIASYRIRRPVIALERAVAIVSPGSVMAVPGKGRFLGALRRWPPEVASSARTMFAGTTGIALRVPGSDPADALRLAEAVGIPGGTGGRTVLACGPRTRERDLRLEAVPDPASVDLLWIS